jgi:hypothetical protein
MALRTEFPAGRWSDPGLGRSEESAMSAVKIIVVWGFVAISTAALAGVLAGIKNRDYSSWMGWTFVFPPLLLVLALLPSVKGPRPKQTSLDEEDAELP